jgi:hypothetical protein
VYVCVSSPSLVDNGEQEGDKGGTAPSAITASFSFFLSSDSLPFFFSEKEGDDDVTQRHNAAVDYR